MLSALMLEKMKKYRVMAILDGWLYRYIATASNYKKAIEIGERFLVNAFFKERWTYSVLTECNHEY